MCTGISTMLELCRVTFALTGRKCPINVPELSPKRFPKSMISPHIPRPEWVLTATYKER